LYEELAVLGDTFRTEGTDKHINYIVPREHTLQLSWYTYFAQSVHCLFIKENNPFNTGTMIANAKEKFCHFKQLRMAVCIMNLQKILMYF
jgi:hypothetical protein